MSELESVVFNRVSAEPKRCVSARKRFRRWPVTIWK